MSDTTVRSNKPRRKLTSLELSPKTCSALKRIKRVHRINFTGAIERSVALLETQLQGGAL